MWMRPGLDQRARRWVTLVGVADSSSSTPIRTHTYAAMASGNATVEEMQEFVLQYAIHGSWPKASVMQAAVIEMGERVTKGFRTSDGTAIQGAPMPTASDMKGKAALVTGAASGLGRATALALGRAGADLCIVDLNAAGLEETANAVARARGTGSGPRDRSVRAPTTARAPSRPRSLPLAGSMRSAMSPASSCMCNAHEMRAADWEKTLAVNLSAPFYLMQAAIPHLLKRTGRCGQRHILCRLLRARPMRRRIVRAKAGLNTPDQGARDGIRAQAHSLQRRRAGRHGHQHRQRPSRCPEGVDYALIKRY